MPYGMRVPSAFEEMLDFHALVLLSRDVELRKQSVMQNAVSYTLAEVTF